MTAVLALAAAFSLCAGQSAKRSKEKAPEPVALIAVSVFREPGFAVAGADIELSPEADEKSAAKMKKWKASGDSRGEYVFRVSPVAMRYTVAVAAKGLKAQRKTVSVAGEGRTDVTFMLEPESK